MFCLRSSPFLKMMAFCSLEVYYLESEHVLSEVVSVLKNDRVLLYRSLLLEGEHVLSEVVPVLEDDGVLLYRSLLLEGEHVLPETVPVLKMMAFCSFRF
jgi:hypothetical protein